MTISEAPIGPSVQAAYRAVDRAIQKGLETRGFDVRMTHSAVLANIDIVAGTRATILADRAAVSKQAMGELIDDLEARGYVRRVPDPNDGRAKLIRLSAKGRKLMAAAYEVIGSIENELLAQVGQKDLSAARRVLDALVEVTSDSTD